MGKITTAVFEPGSTTANAYGLWQYDYGQALRIQGLNLPSAVEIHFSLQESGGTSVSRVGVTKDGVTDVIIPDSMLENDGADKTYDMFAFVYLTDAASGQTEYKIKLQVKSRPKPEAPGGGENPNIFHEAVQAVQKSADKAAESEKQAEGWAHGREDLPERAQDNARYYAGQTAADAKKTEADRKEVERLVESVSGIDQQVATVENLTKQAQTSATNAALSEQAAKTAETNAQTAQAGAETAEGNAELAKQGAKASEQAVEKVKQLVTQMGQEVLDNKNHVDQTVQAFTLTAQQAVADINNAGQTQTERVEGAGNDAVESVKTAQGKATQAVETAKVEAVKAVQTEGTTQTGNVSAEGEKQVQAVQAAAQEIVADREQIDINKKAIETNSKEDAKNKRKLDALWELNRGVSYKFETDSEKAHQKKVPSGAKIMSITKVGGNTTKSNGEFIDTKVDRIEIIGRNLFDEKQELQEITTPDGIRKGISVGKGLGEVFASANNDNKYDVYYYLCCVKSDGSVRNPIDFFIIKNSVSCGSFCVESDEELFIYSAIPNSALMKVKEMKVQIEKGTVQTEYTPYFKETIFIPESVKKMQGYGMGIDGVNNVLDIENMRFVKKIDMLELGQLTWKKFPDENKEIYYAELSDALNAYRVLLSKKYNITDEVFENDKTIKISGDILYIQDSDFMTESDFSNSVLGMKIYYEHIHEVTTAISNENEKINTSLLRAEDGMIITFINNRNDDTPVYNSIEYITDLSEVNA